MDFPIFMDAIQSKLDIGEFIGGVHDDNHSDSICITVLIEVKGVVTKGD